MKSVFGRGCILAPQLTLLNEQVRKGVRSTQDRGAVLRWSYASLPGLALPDHRGDVAQNLDLGAAPSQPIWQSISNRSFIERAV
jgi:hypothetical protein